MISFGGVFPGPGRRPDAHQVILLSMSACQNKADTPGRGLVEATVLANDLICREHYQLRLGTGSFPQTKPGQFVQLGCRPPRSEQGQVFQHEWHAGQELAVGQPELRQPLALLRRPFSLAGRGTDEQGDWVRVTVSDSGPGLTDAAKERLFEPFFTTRDRALRAGLGLALSYGVAAEHQGRLQFETAPDVGTEFHLDLPLEMDADGDSD